MNTILLPTDLSEATNQALNWARLLASHYNARLILLHVQPMPMPDTSMPVIGDLGVGTTVMMDTEPVYQDQLTKLAGQLEAEGLTCQTDLRRGAVKEAILEAAREHQADLIVTGRSDLSSFFDRLIGSEATGIARDAHCPVLVVPANQSDEALRSVSLKNMVFTTPLEFDQDDTFAQAVALARSFGASLRVLHVRASNQPNLNDDAEMTAQLQAVYGTEPLPVDTVEANTVTGGLETYLSDHTVDLLVMTTRERDFLSGLLNPSLTSRMVKLSDVPLLIYQDKGDL